MKPLATFASRLGARITLNSEFVAENAQRYYLLNPALSKVTKADFFYAGLYLGKVKKGMFFPSFNFLNMLVPVSANKIILDKKAAWLFICGRDVFKKGVLKVLGSQNKGDIALVMNTFGECLGFGMIADRLERVEGTVAVRNVLDVGDFLRREFKF